MRDQATSEFKTPSEWIEAINALIDEGEYERAKELYERFKTQYPSESEQLGETINDIMN